MRDNALLNTQLLSNVPIYYPTITEQKAIASTFGALDEHLRTKF